MMHTVIITVTAASDIPLKGKTKKLQLCFSSGNKSKQIMLFFVFFVFCFCQIVKESKL